MDFLIFLVVSVCLVVCRSVPHYPLYSIYLAPPQPYIDYNYHFHRPAVFAPQRPERRRIAPTVSPLIHNSITYQMNPDAEPDDALEVAQFHSQDAVGRVVFGFNTPDQTRMEARALDGTVTGSYSYQDPTGKTVQMHYWDDGTGFHTAGNNLPVTFFSSPGYTPEVQAAREQHFQLYREALAAALSMGSESEVEESQADNSAVQMDSAPYETSGDQVADDIHSEDSDYDSDTDTVAINNPDLPTLKLGPLQRRGQPEATGKQLTEVKDLTADTSSNLAIARTGSDGYQYLVPVAHPAQGQSESLHATSYGAIPVAAVHDVQVSPAQWDNIDNYQIKPVLLKIGADTSS